MVYRAPEEEKPLLAWFKRVALYEAWVIIHIMAQLKWSYPTETARGEKQKKDKKKKIYELKKE